MKTYLRENMQELKFALFVTMLIAFSVIDILLIVGILFFFFGKIVLYATVAVCGAILMVITGFAFSSFGEGRGR